MKFPSAFGIAERDAFYKSVSFDGWGGASGDDAPLIAYDALLGAIFDKPRDRLAPENDPDAVRWEQLCLRGTLHGGDSDSTAILASAWYGALYGFAGVPKNHYFAVEYSDRAVKLAELLHSMFGEE